MSGEMTGKGDAATTAKDRFAMSAFLTGDPPDTDSFGPHQQVAEQISLIIGSGGRERSIALLGEWGAGKTATMKFLERSLSGALVFYYDAWLQEGDHLRRAVLDEFLLAVRSDLGIADIPSSMASGRVKEQIDAASAIEEDIWHRSEEVQTQTEPRLRRHAKLMLASFAAIPLALEFFEVPAVRGDQFWSELVQSRNSVALVLLLAPLFVLALLTLVKMSSWTFGQRLLFGSKGGESTSASAIFFERVSGSTETKKIRSPSDSLNEFRRCFDRIVDLAKGNDGSRAVVVIVDNVDRLSRDRGRDFWSTMQTFFPRPTPNAAATSSYYLIVPFSERILASFLSEDGAGDVARPAIEKSFDISFPLPPPMEADWRAYLLACLRIAFPLHPEQLLLPVRDVIEAIGSQPLEITPRALKSFTNSLVVQYRIAGHELSLQAMTAYLWRRSAIDAGDVSGVLTPTVNQLLAGDHDPIAQITAVRYGVNLEKAEQILLEDPIRGALQAGDGNTLKIYEGRSGFREVLSRVVSTDFLVEGKVRVAAERYVNAAAALGGLSSQLSLWTQHLTTRLVRATVNMGRFGTGLSTVQPHGIVRLLEAEENGSSSRFLRALEGYSESHESGEVDGLAESYMSIAGCLFRHNSEIGEISLPSVASLAMAVAEKHVVSQSPIPFRSRVWDPDDLYSATTWMIENASLTRPIEVMSFFDVVNGEALANTCMSRAMSAAGPRLTHLLQFLLAISRDGKALAAMQPFAAGEDIARAALDNGGGDGKSDIQVVALALMMVAAPKALGPNNRELPEPLAQNAALVDQPASSLVSAVADMLISAKVAGHALYRATTFARVRSLVAQVAERCVLNDHAIMLSEDEFRKALPFLNRHLQPHTVAQMIDRSPDGRKFLHSVIEADLSPGNGVVYAATSFVNEEESTSGVRLTIREKISGAPVEFWLQVLASPDDVGERFVESLFSMRRAMDLQLPKTALDAAVQTAKSIGQGAEFPSDVGRRLTQFMKLLPRRQISFHFAMCRWLAKQDDVTVQNVLAALYGLMKIPAKANVSTVARGIILPGLRTGQLEVLVWARNQLRRLPMVSDEVGVELKQALNDIPVTDSYISRLVESIKAELPPIT